MPKPFKTVVAMPDGSKATSVICDQADFDRAIATLADIADTVTLENLKAAKHLTLAARGTKTKALFEMFEVETDLMSLAVRGLAKRLLAD